jgi:peptidoglycan hydrolase-like protein with peptidoglycan-binding domain
MSVEEIRRVQLILKERGFAVEVDGILGPQTRQAIMTYQRQQGIQVTGEFDQRTSTSLGVTSAGRDQPGNQDRSAGDRDRPGQRPTADQQGNQQGGQPASTGQGDDRATPRTNPPGSDPQRGNNAPDNARDGAKNNRPVDRSPLPSR